MSNVTEMALPPEWEDDERMNFLFSDFKENRDVNTTDWDSKMDFWSSLAIQSCRSRGTVCVNLQELNKIFRRKGTLPLGLPTVIQSMARAGKVQRESEFAANVDSGWLSWGVGLLLVKPLKWTFSTLLGSSRVPLEESFVVIELVKEKAAELLAAYKSSAFASRSLLSFQELCALSSHVCTDESTLCMAVLQLQREKQVIVSLHEGEKIVKFCRPGQDRVSPVSDVDIGIYQLQCSEKLLGERVDALGVESEKCREEARALLREGKKSQVSHYCPIAIPIVYIVVTFNSIFPCHTHGIPQALRRLRGQKLVEKRADKLFSQLETIKGILDRIAQSQTDKLVLQAYEAGVAALRLSLKDVSVERAESLVDQIQELCDTQDEVNQIIAGGGSSSEDTEELEEELKSLLEDSKSDGISGLPEVPTNPLSPDGISGLPEVPTNPLSPAREPQPSLPGSNLLNSLPTVPQSCFNITDEELEKELNRLTLADSGFQHKEMSSPAKRLEPAQ